MSIINDFVMRYEREYDFFEKVCKKAEIQLDELLSDAGIRAIVTSRAKSPVRLREKLIQRNEEKEYKDEAEVYSDIVDLAGVRVALYFPDANLEVDKIIKDAFELISDERKFPKPGAIRKTGNRVNRFPGYVATHYRVKLKAIDGVVTRYHDAPIEIQVASVLMHAWSEVEHDLVYKPLNGDLSDEEYAILDEINGLVLAGEIALERLKHAGVVRTFRGNNSYTNQYELAASMIDIYKELANGDSSSTAVLSNIGRVNVLLGLLRKAGLNNPEKLKGIMIKVLPDFSESKPVVESIINYLLDESPNLIAALSDSEINASKAYNLYNFKSGFHYQTFFERYDEVFSLLKNFKSKENPNKKKSLLELLSSAPEGVASDFNIVRNVRNRLVHGTAVASSELLMAHQLLDEIQETLEKDMRSNAS
ncbi:RelA/SpoT domain-containing protein [Erwiniaceae bacterium L1_54_6]|nr:RelA/SpoT domain-containing protein [Erwiniaceae bacterium L1_54_6]